jgi:hypothetical protein
MPTLQQDIHNSIKFQAWLHPSKDQPGRMVDVDEIWWSKNRLKETNGSDHSLANATLRRFTGLLDKSGKEIWEGDILRVPQDMAADWIAPVTFENGYFQPLLAICDYSINCIADSVEVIGNIYENENLLTP